MCTSALWVFAYTCWSAPERLSHSAVWPDLQELYKDSGAASQILVTFWRLPVIYLFLVLTRGWCCFPAFGLFAVSCNGGLNSCSLQPLHAGNEPSPRSWCFAQIAQNQT